MIRKQFHIILLSLLSSLILVTLAFAGVPKIISYQGYLKNSDGTPVNSATSMTFSLYSTANGAGAVWSGSKSITPVNGVYSVELGANPQPALPTFERPYWLGVQTGGDPEMRPLQPLTSVPYALRAATAEQVSQSALPANGLNEISNGLLTNQFVRTVASTAVPLPIPDNNPNGVTDSIVFPNVGTAETITVSLNLTNSNLSTITVTLTAPNATVYTLFNGATGGTTLNTSFPNPTTPVSGNLNAWIGQNPTGTWTLKVVDSSFLNNTTDGSILAWSIAAQHVSTQKVAVAGNLEVSGALSGNGSGLTNLSWTNLTNIPAGFADGVDNVSTSVDGLAGGRITGNIGIGVSPFSNNPLRVYGDGVDDNYTGYFNANYPGSLNSYSLYANNSNAGAGSHYGLYSNAQNSSSANFGVAAHATGTAGTYNYGLYASATGGSSSNRAVYGSHYNSSTSSTSSNYGVQGYSYGLGSSSNFGIYGEAYGTNAYAGFFANDVAILGNTTIGTSLKDAGKKLKVTGDSSDQYAAYFENNATTGSAYGSYSVAQGTTDHALSYNHFGAFARASGARYNYGSYSYADDSNATTNYGLYTAATGGVSNYGLNSQAYDTSASYNYGLYAYAAGGTNSNYGVFAYAPATAGSYAGYFSGNLAYTGTISDVSDRRLKDNIRPVENALVKVQGINGVYFNMKDSPGQTEVGVIAQDVQAVLPEAVSVIDAEKGYLGVSYTSLIPVLIEAVKELKKENESLKARLEQLEKVRSGQ